MSLLRTLKINAIRWLASVIVVLLVLGPLLEFPTNSTPNADYRLVAREESSGGVCESDADCHGVVHGNCSLSECVCTAEYYGAHCGQKRKDQQLALILVIVVSPIFGLPPGAARFYLGYIADGVGQVILGLAWMFLLIPLLVHVVCSFCCMGAGVVVSDNENDVVAVCGFLSCGTCSFLNVMIFLIIICIQIACSLAVLVWWIIDIVHIADGSMKAYGGVAMYKGL